jgi:multidrug efflux pump
MMLSDVSVKRPVLAAVAAIVLCVLGAAAFFALPVRELPNIDQPIVSISTSYRGASAEVIESRITEVIERQVAGIQGQERITSTSRDGSSRISIEFSPAGGQGRRRRLAHHDPVPQRARPEPAAADGLRRTLPG